MIIDAHHHFWLYDAGEFSWIADEMAAIRRDFEPHDLQNALQSAGIDGVISVQARQSLEETEWLLGLARETDFMRGVVGWVPLAAPDIEAVLERFSEQSHLKAVRHVVQSEADDFLEGAAFNAGISLLQRFDLVYDLLIVERQLPAAIAFVDRHPNQVFVLDHLAKPLAKAGVLEPWATQLRALARRENVFCKVSGLVTEADLGSWTPQELQPYFETALDAFGAQRLMFGSDWPVCLAACDYARWAHVVREWAAPLSTIERAALFGGTATRAYQL